MVPFLYSLFIKLSLVLTFITKTCKIAERETYLRVYTIIYISMPPFNSAPDSGYSNKKEDEGLSRRSFLKGVGAAALGVTAGSLINNEVQAGDMSFLGQEIKEIKSSIALNNKQIDVLLALSADDITKINNGEEVVLDYKKEGRYRTDTAYQSGPLSSDAKRSMTTGAVMGLMGGSVLGGLDIVRGLSDEDMKDRGLHVPTTAEDVAHVSKVALAGAAIGATIGGLRSDFSTGILQNFIESVKSKNEKITDDHIIKEIKRLKGENEVLLKTLEPKVALLNSMVKNEQVRKDEIKKSSE